MSADPRIRAARPRDDVLPVIHAAFTDEGEQVARLWAELEQRANAYGVAPASARTPEAALQRVRFAGHEDWMTGQVIYHDVWWRHDCVGLRDPMPAEIKEMLR